MLFCLCLFLYQKNGFLFFDTLVSLLVHLVIFVLNSGEFFGHVLTCEVKQKACNGIFTVGVLEIGYQIVPADDSFYLDGEISHNIHFILVREIIRVFSGNTHGCKMFFA